MIMRKRPIRGEKYHVDGYSETLTIIEVLNGGKGEMVSVILPDGTLGTVHKNKIQLPTIDTGAYEKI